MMNEKAQDAEFTGKYENSGRLGRLLLSRFYNDVRELLEPKLKPRASVLEVGCGAGYSTEQLLHWLPAGSTYMGCDVGESLLTKARARNPQVAFTRQSVYALSLPDKSVDAIVMLEVLEHLRDPTAALVELKRVAKECVILSTPREPIWCMLNMARGKYLRAFGNTPGHVQHWSSRGLSKFVRPHFEVVAIRRPLPWTILSLGPNK